MNLTHSADPIRTDAVVSESGRTAVQYVSVNYSVPSQTFENTSFVFTVDKDALSPGTTPSEIAFSRYSGGAWRAQNATLISESDSTYRFRVTTNGFSQFVITGPTADEHAGCELFGIDYGSFIVCWYWWLLAAGVGLALVGYRVWRRGMRDSLLDSTNDSHQDEAVGGDDDD